MLRKKGGCFITIWIRALPLCTRGIGDQDYSSKTRTFGKQKYFTNEDETSNANALNVLDNGY